MAADISHEITAVFSSADEAQQARELIEEKSIRPHESMRISAERVLHVEVAQGDMERVAEALRSAGAVGIKYTERQTDSGWFGHHTDRITGSAVAPGEGDAEAGALDHREN